MAIKPRIAILALLLLMLLAAPVFPVPYACFDCGGTKLDCNEPCTSNSQCCSNFCAGPSNNKLCYPKPGITECTETYVCSQGYFCVLANGENTCEDCIPLQGGVSCSSSADCCFGLQCVDDMCVSQGSSAGCSGGGTCIPSSSDPCKSYDQACTSDSQCVKGLSCLQDGSLLPDGSPDPSKKKCTQPICACTVAPEVYNDVLPPTTSSTAITPLSQLEDLSAGQGQYGSSIFKTGWFSDWNSAGLVGVMIAVLMIALAAMAGMAFNIPELKAFSHSEMMQAVVSVLLIVGLIAIVAFFDTLAAQTLAASDLPVACTGAEPCYITAAKYYMGTLQNMSLSYSKTALEESFKFQRMANYGVMSQANKWYLVYFGVTTRPQAGQALYAERAGAIYSANSKLAASLEAQQYFLSVVAFGIAPVFLLLGVVLRTFFFTRKLGGLLLAIGISLFIVYPLTYAFAWYTLNTTVYGERTVVVADPACPSECAQGYPVAFFIDPDTSQIKQFATTQSLMRAGITNANWKSGNVDADPEPEFYGLTACRDLSKAGIIAPLNCPSTCPDYCRESPMPQLPGCDATDCADCNAGCKIIRQRDPATCQSTSEVQCDCPRECRVALPMAEKCFINDVTNEPVPAQLGIDCGGDCAQYPQWCKQKTSTGTGGYALRYPDEAACTIGGVGVEAACNDACFYISEQQSGSMLCADQCTKDGKTCPLACRVTDLADPAWMAQYDLDPPGMDALCNQGEYAAACNQCPASCKVNVPDSPPEGCAAYPAGSSGSKFCADCPLYCRFPSFDFIPSYSNTPLAAGTPTICVRGTDGKPACSSADPEECGSECKPDLLPNTPMICRPLDENDPDQSLCRACPEGARYNVRFNKTGICPGGGAPGGGDPDIAPPGEYTVLLSGAQKPSGAILLSGAGSFGRAIKFAGDGGGNPQNQVTMISSRIAPAPAYATSTLMGYCNASHTGGGVTYLTYNYTWFKDGAPFSSGQVLDIPSDVETNIANISSASLAVGQAWVFYCYAFHPSGSAGLNSSAIAIQDPLGEDPCTVTVSPVLVKEPTYSCSDTLCGSSCKGPIAELPNPSTNPLCEDAEITGCPYGCRVNGVEGYLDPSCLTPACESLKAAGCFAEDAQVGQVCSEYLGNGPQAESCHNKNCISMADPEVCSAAGCSWDESKAMCNAAPCTDSSPAQCAANPICEWSADPLMPLELRNPPYDDQTSCRQCPENCRIMQDGVPYEGSCGMPDGTVDCSLASCGTECRVAIPSASAMCQAPSQAQASCQDCPALCRRSDNVLASQIGMGAASSTTLSAECTAPSALSCHKASCIGISDLLTCNATSGCSWYSSVPKCDSYSCSQIPDQSACGEAAGCIWSSAPLATVQPLDCSTCSDSCKLPDPPLTMCAGCNECDLDCTYYPAVRTDCSDICSEEALSGTVDIAPDDFINGLPGAATAAGYTDSRNIGTLMVPALVLPLFCIVITLVFIRTFSPILGGDIEIPGIGRII